jgi:hypothetical protein
VVPTQVLCAAGAATLLIDAVGTTLMANGRPRSLLAYGVAHFAVYMAAVLAVAQLGIVAVACAAAVIHGVFLAVAYVMLTRAGIVAGLRCLWSDVGAGLIGCTAVLALGIPVHWAVSSTGVPGIINVLAVALVATPAYLLVLRVAAPAAFADLMLLITRLLPRPSAFGHKPTAPLVHSSS